MQSETSLPIIVLPNDPQIEGQSDGLAPLVFELQMDMPFARVHDYFLADLRPILLHSLQTQLPENLETIDLSSLEMNLIPTEDKADFEAQTQLVLTSTITRSTGSLIFTKHNVSVQPAPPSTKASRSPNNTHNLIDVRALWSITRT